MRSSGKRGFTLIELMLSVAIFGILTAIVFTAFAKDKTRNAAKRLADNVQISIQEQQQAAQSGLVVSGVQPAGFGLAFSNGNAVPVTSPNKLRYIVFGDGLGGGTVQQEYNSPAEYIKTMNLPANTEVFTLRSNAVNYSRVEITFDVPDGSVTLKAFAISPPYVVLTNPVIITLRQTQANICYSVTIQPKFGTVSRRSLASCT